jgi:hypothetical protein
MGFLFTASSAFAKSIPSQSPAPKPVSPITSPAPTRFASPAVDPIIANATTSPYITAVSISATHKTVNIIIVPESLGDFPIISKDARARAASQSATQRPDSPTASAAPIDIAEISIFVE